MENQEINLRSLLYKTMLKWKKVFVIALIVSILAGLLNYLSKTAVYLDEEKYEKALNEYELLHSTWESLGQYYDKQIEDLTLAKNRQEEYNNNSLLMKIDPLQEFYGLRSYYMYYDYQIMPDKTYQNIDYTAKLLGIYARLGSSGELYDYVLKNTSITSELKYLKEVLSFWTSSGDSTINISVVGASEAEVRSIMTLVDEFLQEKTASIANEVAVHTLSTITESVYSEINFSLQDKQQYNSNYVLECDKKIADINEDKEDWKKEAEPVFEYSQRKILTGTIKFVIIGFFGGIVLGLAYFMFLTLLGPLVWDEDAWKSMNISVLGKITDPRLSEKQKKHAHHASALLGLSRIREDFAVSCSITEKSIRSLLAKEGISSAQLIGDLDSALAQQLLPNFRDLPYSGNILNSTSAIESLSATENVILLVDETKTRKDDVLRIQELLSLWGKNLVGAVLIQD